jgi:hypothetical protein
MSTTFRCIELLKDGTRVAVFDNDSPITNRNSNVEYSFKADLATVKERIKNNFKYKGNNTENIKALRALEY